MVYWLTRRLLVETERQTSLFPLVAALLFGLHPVNAESVNWVSGRTDLVALFFVLLTACLLLVARDRRNKWWLLPAFFALFMGMLAKEVALGFFPGAIMLFLSRPAGAVNDLGQRASVRMIKLLLVFSLATAAALLSVAWLRSLAFTSTKEGIPLTLSMIAEQPLSMGAVMLGALGFYLKKIFFPWPLSFAITAIGPYYWVLGIVIAGACLYCLCRKEIWPALFVAGVGVILPALPIAIGKIAWTPYAERYVYVASPFIILSAIMGLRRTAEKLSTPAARLRISLVCLGILAATTLHRNFIWTSNLSLFEDTARKNPGFARVRGEYGLALAMAGQYGEAKRQLLLAQELPSPYYNKKYALNYARILAAEHDALELEKVYAGILKATDGGDEEAFAQILGHYSDRSLYEKGEARKQALEKLVHYTRIRYEKFKDPADLYRIGQFHESLADSVRARESYTEALRVLPAGHPLRKSVEKSLQKLASS